MYRCDLAGGKNKVSTDTLGGVTVPFSICCDWGCTLMLICLVIRFCCSYSWFSCDSVLEVLLASLSVLMVVQSLDVWYSIVLAFAHVQLGSFGSNVADIGFLCWLVS